MEQRGNKTVMCSVLFLDIEGYSKKPVSGQIALKDRFNAFLADALRNVPVNDRIILDTGDGAAISFLGDVEDALKVALAMRKHLLGENISMDMPLLMRMGINLGPVRLVKDINGQPNIVGDGINVAQRVMGFAASDQILVSRSYYDAVSRLSPEHTGMFHYQGEHTDKHVRAHEVYAIGYPGEVNKNESLPDADAAENTTVAEQEANAEAQTATSTFRQAYNQHRTLFLALIVGAMVLLLAAIIEKSRRHAPLPEITEASAPGVIQPASEVAAAVPKLAESVAATKSVETAHTSHGTPKPAARESAKHIPAQLVTLQTAPDTTKDTAVPTPHIASPKDVPVPSAMADVAIAVTPWGEVYLDGRIRGVSPPLAELQVTAGKHLVEFRNTSFPPYSQSIQVKAGEKIKIQYKFAN